MRTNAFSSLLVLRNPDGTARWLWPAHQQKPLFLAFYAAGTFRARVFVAAIRLLFALRLQRLFFGKALLEEVPNVPAADLMSRFGGNQYAIFTGTPGPNRKVVVVGANANGPKWFWKAPINTQSAPTFPPAMKHEWEMMHHLQAEHLQYSHLPHAILANDGLWTTALPTNLKRSTRLEPQHIAAVTEWVDKTHSTSTLSELSAWQESQRALQAVSPATPLLHSLKESLEQLSEALSATNIVQCGFSHGDFTPWNTYLAPDSLWVYDFEQAHAARPVWFDLFHFQIQTAVMVEGRTPEAGELLARVAAMPGITERTTVEQLPAYLAMYLTMNGAYYTRVYAEQGNLHPQAVAVVQAWTDLAQQLYPLLRTHKSMRPLLLEALPQMLTGSNYALLKPLNASVGSLDTSSDLDLVISPKEANDLIIKLQITPWIPSLHLTRKPHMTTAEIALPDGGFLRLDLIHALRRRYTTFLRVRDVLNAATPDPVSGLRTTSMAMSLRYVALFFGLNGSPVPEKYRLWWGQLGASGQAHLIQSLQKTLDWNITTENDLFAPDAAQLARIQKQLAYLPENQGISGLKSRIAYVWSSLMGERGRMVTFTGVDGAGKTTVLYQIKEQLETRYRKQVVVLRHRPGILPILSAWKHGKAGAEAISVSRMPRQGTNDSLLSSLFRFGYYYIDYVLGQWYVFLRYTLRGTWVLYDRYYYDFMADGRRTNIALPEWITNLGWLGVRKPDLNVYLWATPEAILARKQELSATDIVSLNNAYQRVFRRLRRSQPARFLLLENRQLNATLQTILANAHP